MLFEQCQLLLVLLYLRNTDDAPFSTSTSRVCEFRAVNFSHLGFEIAEINHFQAFRTNGPFSSQYLVDMFCSSHSRLQMWGMGSVLSRVAQVRHILELAHMFLRANLRHGSDLWVFTEWLFYMRHLPFLLVNIVETNYNACCFCVFVITC